MNIFFGKISASANQEFNQKQIDYKRYYADKGSSWFGDIQPNDYCYIISGQDVYFWQAEKWGNDNDGDFLQFTDIFEGKLPINGNQFRALNFLKFNSDLMVLTIRQVQSRAFFKLELTSEPLIDNLKIQEFYKNLDSYRNIVVVDSNFKSFNAKDIYLIRSSSAVNLHKSDFFDDATYKNFRDNTKFNNGKRKNKNVVLNKIVNSEIEQVFNSNDLSLNGLYDAFFVEYDKEYESVTKEENGDNNMPNNSQQNMSLNQILYGPPGTGKTYNTINRALEIVDGKVPDKREEAKRRFDELKNAGQIVFTTFHQSFGYEEFVEGIKAIPTGKDGNEDGEEMIYDVVDGVFKKLSKLALENFILQATKTAINKKRFTLNAKSLNIQAELAEDDENTYRVLKGSKIRKAVVPSFHKYNYSELRNKFFENAKFDSKKETDEFYILEEDYVFQSLSASSSVILGKMSNGKSDWKEVFNNENLSFSLDEKKETKNYILIIDEINRGNISKIFGELITLIESSKRIGADEEIMVKLPYSGDEFGVPQNVYIIGTMNTADRSIALMDTALRRRFHFEEMMPDYEVLKELVVDGAKVDDMLQKINERIEYLYDRDHQIGHAYFMSLLKATNGEEAEAELDNIFRNKIIPLLQEYFYDDWEKIQMVLGDHPEQKAEDGDKFIKSTPSKEKVIFGFDYNDIADEKMKYEINKIFSSKAYAKIYS